MFAFLILLFVALTVYHMTSKNEGFQGGHTVTIPTNRVVARLSALPEKDPADLPKPANPPGQLPVAPYEELATMSPLPYQDTTQVKANRQQLINLLEMLKGFLAYEAQSIVDSSDPSIQLPLHTARSDFHTIQSEVSVLNRNPGIQPTITLLHLTDISANLAFLQRKVRLLGTAGALQGPAYPFTESADAKGIESADAKGIESAKAEGFTNATRPSVPATLAQLKDFMAKIQVEILRLSASGTTDPVITARVAALTTMKLDVKYIADQLESGTILPTESPINKADIDRAFPVLGKLSDTLPQVIRYASLPPFLASLLPSALKNDPSAARKIAEMVDKYADTIINGISASFKVEYNPAQIPEKKRRLHSTIDKTGFPSFADIENVSQSKFQPSSQDRPVTDRFAARPDEAGRGPASFDWKERSRQIEDQIRRRGLNPNDFGVMPRTTKVSPQFSWRGYAKMICTRLQATMDTGLPVACGCPPMDWKGWDRA